MTESTSASPAIHVVLGAGQVGPILAEKLVAAGHDVRVICRKEPRAIAGARWISADLTDLAAARDSNTTRCPRPE